jgi:putative protease
MHNSENIPNNTTPANSKTKHPNYELLAPAGDLTKLRTALRYGADAVYFGGTLGSLRSASDNFTENEIHEGVSLCHNCGKRAYLALNIIAHDEDFAGMDELLRNVKNAGIDAFIVSDPGVFELVRARIPDANLHISTQANVTNAATARFWHSLGAKRVVLARELSLAEIRKVRDAVPDDLELEAFVHGAMCISYSGRCLLSNVMTGRDANRGNCAHPCRYSYALVEEKRPGEYLPIREDARGAYIMNSKDLCMAGRLADLGAAGITSFKIEGRVKSEFYVASVTKVYREVVDMLEKNYGNNGSCGDCGNDGLRKHYLNNENNGAKIADTNGDCEDEILRTWMEELGKTSHRGWTTGFYYGKPGGDSGNYSTSGYVRDYAFIGMVVGVDSTSGTGIIEQRNKFSVGEALEIFGPKPGFTEFTVEFIEDEDGNRAESAPHPKQRVRVNLPRGYEAGDMVRRRNGR